ncbi:MAG: MiaB/RimO family radical SAM methylthiotransferase [Candidatus Uhrbacteria bacterium]|nr:MiaB/RimO family radical SAM methylthiotransferase [Candidatus Uhrbacteria bacterium]MDP3794236.1 MiaB/RimO family radical SAM methylthiotransferase [Candidatus Uhrbacteria bacterium]
MPSPTFSITTYGCQMNKNDSERIAGLLSSLGFVSTEDESRADLIVINTCSVRQSAENRVYGSQEKYLEYKKEKPNMIVAVTGCMPGRDKAREFQKRLPATDLYFPTPDMVHLPKWIAELRPDLVNSTDLESDYLKIHPLRAPSVQAYVTIQTGCNKFCTYCVVPYARGLERNRSVADILQECRELVAHGIIEITLLGQTVNSFRTSDPENFSSENPFCHSCGGRNPSDGSPGLAEPRPRMTNGDHFAALLWELNQLDGLERLHWTAAHPLSMSDEVIAALALPKQVNYLHLPVQSGSNDVLRRMNRKYTREQYLEKIAKIKAARPGIALGTDIIVGFPGETREQFAETLSLYREVEFDVSYNAQYSPRSGTLGVKLYQDDIPKEEKRERWDDLQALMEDITLKKNQALIGQTVSVLVDRIDHGFAIGNSREMKLVRFPLPKNPLDPPYQGEAGLVGQIVHVRVTDAKAWVLTGELVGKKIPVLNFS